MIGSSLWVRFSTAGLLRLTEDGVEAQGIYVPWSNIGQISRERIGLRRVDAFVLDEPIVFPRWVTLWPRRSLPLGMFDPHWRNGPIAEDIARWAPALLEEPTR